MNTAIAPAVAANASPPEPSPDQVAVISAVRTWLDRGARTQQVLSFGGYAGTGKTTVVALLARQCPSPVAFVAFTGKATCAGCNPPPPKPRVSPCPTCGDARFTRRTALDRDYKLIIVDEASMVSDDLLEHLKSFGVPILAVGDHGQLPPVRGQGSLMVRPDLRLERIHRQAAGNPIIALSARVRETGAVDEGLADGARFTVVPARGLAKLVGDRFTRARLDALDGSILSTGLISPTNKLRCSLNSMAREALGTAGEPPARGEVVICLKNTPPVYNGMRALLTSGSCPVPRTRKVSADLRFVEDGLEESGVEMFEEQFLAERTFDQDALRALGTTYARAGDLYDFGYAMTAHKAQGSQFAEAVVVLDYLGWMQPGDRARWIYTAVTRAADRLVVVR
jgi:UvrD-like helicase family protein/AAA domain-containing protein